VLKKQRTGRDVLFIDASKLYEKKKTPIIMTADHIRQDIVPYVNRQSKDKEAHLASYDEIKENGYNLNIPRYVDTFEEEEQIDLADVNEELRQIDVEMADTRDSILAMLGQLKTDDEKMAASVKDFIKMMEDI